MQNALPRVCTIERASARFAYQTPNSFGGRGAGARVYVTSHLEQFLPSNAFHVILPTRHKTTLMYTLNGYELNG